MNNQIGFGRARFGGKTFTQFWSMIKAIDPEMASLLSECLEENLTLKEVTMPEIPITTMLKNDMDTFKSSILKVAEECYKEMSLKDMYIVKKWAEGVENIHGDVWKMLSKVSSLVDRDQNVVAKYALAGLWYYYQTPAGSKKGDENDGN